MAGPAIRIVDTNNEATSGPNTNLPLHMNLCTKKEEDQSINQDLYQNQWQNTIFSDQYNTELAK